MNGCWIAASLSLPLLLTSISNAAEAPTYYSIKLNDKLIGYAMVRSEAAIRDERTLAVLKSTTSLKIALLGQGRTMLADSETLVEPSTGKAISYQLTDTTNELVRRVEVEFDAHQARTWSYRQGDPRGEPVETRLPEDVVILGNNNFGHWRLLLQAASQRVTEGVAKVTVFLPDAPQLDTFELTRGAPRDVAVGAETRKCVPWRLEKANLTLLADAQTNELIRMDVPAQRTTIELADESTVKLAQKSRAEEVLGRHFAQSNVAFDDFLKIRQLEIELDVAVIGSGVENDPAVLSTSMQRFNGEKKVDAISGTIHVHSVPYHGANTPPFPTKGEDAELAEWLKPSVYIESDHPAIVAQSTELTQGAATRWEAIERIGKWVHREITYTLGDTPSARLAFEKRKGDCGPHATLMVALLRAASIPARLVGGLVYTPTFGGSFGQHAWVEAHLGEGGWIAMDPTTGEFEQLSATHIKLFEGLGGVLPTSVKVVAFQPPNREVAPVDRSATKPLSWKLDKEYTFKFTQGDKELGTETITIREVTHDGGKALQLHSKIKLQVNLLVSMTSNTTLTVHPNALPLKFDRHVEAAIQVVRIVCKFREENVQEEISGTTNLSREIKIPKGTYCFDNNLMGCFMLICSQLNLEPGKEVTVQTFHPSTLQIIPLTFTPKAPAPLKIGDRDVECFECDVAPINNQFWISRDGRFVRAKQGDLLIELTNVE